MSDSAERYDSRRAGRRNHDRTSVHRSSSDSRRDRSRSRSPDVDIEKRKQADDRRARMARLRAENDQEEQEQTAVLDDVAAGVAGKQQLGPQEAIIEVNQEELEGLDEEEQMRKLLGFTGSFGSTKGSKVEDNHSSSAKGVAAKHKARKYRQYMNRKNGFNRPLEKMD